MKKKNFCLLGCGVVAIVVTIFVVLFLAFIAWCVAPRNPYPEMRQDTIRQENYDTIRIEAQDSIQFEAQDSIRQGLYI